jgi:hypothetical protein
MPDLEEADERHALTSDHPRRAMARALQHHGIAIEPGLVRWNDALEPKVERLAKRLRTGR